MGTARQFGLLLWKNFIIQRRKICVTVLEIGIPTLFALILIAVRQIVIATPVNHPTTYSPYNISLIPNNLTAPGHRWKIYYTPNTSVIHDIMNKTKYQLSEGNQAFDVKAFDDEDSMVRKLVTELQTKDKCSTLAAIVFTNMPANGSLPDNIIYKIRLSSSPRNTEKDPMHLNPFTIDTNWMTEFQFPLFQKIGPREKTKSWGGKPGYMREGFLALQYNIDQAIVKVMNTSGSTGDFWVQLQRYPYPIYKDDNFILVIQKELPYFIMLSFVFCALHIVKDIVHEKERRLKETMKLMGLSSWLHWSAWFVKSLLFLLISVGIMTLFFCINTGQYGSVIGATDPSILFVFLLVFAISTICFSFAVSVFFNKANSAAAAGGICFFFSYTPYYFLQLRYDTLSMAAKLGTSLISNVAMSYGCQIIGLFEGTGVGVQWSNINQTVSVDDNLTLLHILLMLLLDAVLYLLLALYIEAVWPGEFGMPQPWYFPVLPSFWCKLNSKEDDITDEFTPLLDSSRLCRRNTDYFETEPVGLKAGIKIRSLTKVFGKGPTKKVAVDGMTLNMYEGQICALLGHNGAGKTTTMSMLTGFFPPTSGTALLNDFDIMRDICRVRESLGLCPQHDVLFDTLTVEEHLIFFAKLKDCPSDQVSEEVERMLEAIGLCSKRRALAKTLSGGMKRKLSVGIALIAKSKIVILDEPTSGMDPNARRQMWELLLKQRGNRTILLSTHFMDEADYLGDRIAIMAEGVVQCCGTPLFLKNRYGAGYHMVMVKEDSCDVAEVTRLVTSFVPDARLETNISAELSYILPHESKDQFEALFTEIEARKTDLKVTGYGASVTTMEEVFLRVGESADENLKNKLQNSSRSHQEGPGDDRVLTAGFVKNTGLRFYLQQFYAMFVKRMLHTFRNWMVTLAQLAVPLIFTVIALVVLKTLPHPEDSPSLSLNMSHFDANDVLYTTGYDVTPDVEHLAGMYAEQFRGSNSKMIYLNNLTDMSIDDYIVMIGNESLARYNDHLLIAAEFVDTVSNNLTKIISHFNGQAFHTPAISLNAVNNAILRFVTTANHSIRTINHPLPRTVNEEINQQLTQNFEGFSLALNTVFGMSFLASSFVLFLVKERTIKAKHCQFASGVHLLTFWGATLLWDLINYLIPCVLLLVTFAAFGVEAYVADGRLWYLLLLFLLYGWAVLPCMYVMSFLFTVPSSGLVWLTMFNIISGIATILAVNILMIPQLNTMDVAKALEWLFLTIMPNFCLGQGMTDLYSNYEYLSICNNVTLTLCGHRVWNPCCKGHCGDTCVDFQTNYLAWEYSGIGRMLVFLAIQGCFYLCILFLMESSAFEMLWYRVFARKNPTLGGDEATERLIQEDSDVALERQRILTMSLDALYVDDSLVLRELTKHYNGLTAVDRVSVGIKHGECFGLLGINGAGKTSTFKMLTGDEIISSGTAYLGARDIKNNLSMVRQQLGYCPQFDALIDQLTGRETLTMYARLRGVKGHLIPDVVQDLISSLLLEGYADQLVATYSGGNKRKLSTAVSLVGDPPIIFLDEPSTGMDPVARRLLWDTLSRIRSAGRTLVLTSHSMEECEALCTRLAIMVNGQFKCLGSPQHLKTKFGQGYTLIAKVGFPVDGGMPDARPLMDFIESTFPGSVLKDVHQGMVHYHIADTSIPWGRLFGTMQRASRKYNIEDYSVSQTSLELVFINFARSQLPPVENMAGCCKKMWAVCRTPPGGCLCCLCQRDEEELETIVGSESQTSLNA